MGIIDTSQRLDRIYDQIFAHLDSSETVRFECANRWDYFSAGVFGHLAEVLGMPIELEIELVENPWFRLGWQYEQKTKLAAWFFYQFYFGLPEAPQVIEELGYRFQDVG